MHMRRSILICLALICLMLACGRSGQTGGESVEAPALLWKYEGLGRGYGGPCITKEGIFINAEEQGKSYTVCLDLNGSFRWKAPNGKEFMGVEYSASFPGTRSAPAVKGRQVYAASGMGHLSCFDTRKGTVIWTVDLINDFNGKLGDFGYSESPVVDRDKVYCFAGGRVNNLVALDRLTGELLWSAPVKQDSFAYSTPILLNLPDRKILVGTSRNYIHVVDRQDGALLSSYRLEDIRYGYEHCNSVVHQDGNLYFVACEERGQGSIKLSLSEDGESLTEIWRNPEVLNIFGGFVVLDKWLYTTLDNKKLVALDTGNGRIKYAVRAENGSITQANQRLYVYGYNGKLQCFSLKDGEPELNSEMRIRHGSGHHFSFPVISNGVMYLRRGETLMVYSL